MASAFRCLSKLVGFFYINVFSIRLIKKVLMALLISLVHINLTYIIFDYVLGTNVKF